MKSKKTKIMSTNTKSNLSESAQECMKRIPSLTTALRGQGLVDKINDIMQHKPNITYGEVVDTILDFDDVNTECITRALTQGDTKGEIILSNYGRKCTATIKKAGEFFKAEEPEEQPEVPANHLIKITAIEPGKRIAVEETVGLLTGYDQVEVKMMLKELPAVVEVGLTQQEAEEFAFELEASGATVSLEQQAYEKDL